jgi:hypothetical protein
VSVWDTSLPKNSAEECLVIHIELLLAAVQESKVEEKYFGPAVANLGVVVY